MNDIRTKVLRFIYNAFPFDVEGDALIPDKGSKLISCIIPTHNRLNELERLLHCLAVQSLHKSAFEVIIIEDELNEFTKSLIDKFARTLDIIHLNSVGACNSVGAMRNRGLEASNGRYILFLDDDTVIWQTDFLEVLHNRFLCLTNIDCILISAQADRSLLKHRYSYINKYSYGAACIAYTRNILKQMGGLVNKMSSYEDIELAIRFTIIGGNSFKDEQLFYLHPPFYFTSWRKPISNGLSFIRMRKRYSFPLWLLCYLNALRFLPLLAAPSIRLRQWGKLSAGFLVALWIDFFTFFKPKSVLYK